MITRRVVKAFEAWDPVFGMLVIMNSGAALRIIRIAFNQRIAVGRPPIARAVEFESGNNRYYAAFERMQENTAPDDVPDGTQAAAI